MPKVRFKPLVPVHRTKKHLTKKEIADRRRKVERDKMRRLRARLTPEQKKERKQQEDARLFDWARVLPNVHKREDGCWEWQGPFRENHGRVRPMMRAGVFGRLPADFVVCCLAKGYPPLRCTVTRTCETISCVAPNHLEWTVRVVERAKKRRQRHEEGSIRRQQG